MLPRRANKLHLSSGKGFLWGKNAKGTEERMTAATNNISLVIYSLKNTFAYPSMSETMENKAKIENHYEIYFHNR